MNNFHLEEITNRLRRVEKRENIKSLLKGFLYFASAAAALAFLFVLSESLFHFHSGTRTVLFYVLIFLSIIIFAGLILPSLYNFLKKPDLFSAADKVGASHPQIKDELLNSLQLLKEKDKNYSEELIDGAFEKVYRKSEGIDFNDAVKMNTLNSLMKRSAAILFFALFFIIFFSGLRASAFRLINYQQEFIVPPSFAFEVYPGNTTLTKGDDLEIRLEIKGDLPETFFLKTKSKEETGFLSKKFNTDSSYVYIEKIKSLKSSTEYFVEAEEITSEIFFAKVIDRPQIKSLALDIQPPKYSRLPNTEQRDNGNVAGLPGTKINLELQSTKKIKNAELIFSDSSKTSMNIDEKRASADFIIHKEDEYFIKIYDEENLENNFPIVYGIKILRDEYPEIKIVSPAKDLNLPLDEIIFLSANVSDDYGFRKLTLNYRVSSSKYGESEEEFSSVEIPVSKYESPQDVYHTWDLTQLRLNSEDVVSYYLEIFDNDNFNGPKSAKSKIYKLRVPSMDELFVEADEVHESAEEELVESLKEAQKLNEEIEEISAELKRDEREISWNEKEKIENAMQKFEELGEKVDEVKEKINEMKNDLQQNELLSEETLKKYMELQQLFDEMNNEELKNAFEKMNDMLKDLSRKNVQNIF